MTHLLPILGGLAGAVVGFIALVVAASVLSGSSGSADTVAGKMMVAFFVIAPFGALAGLVLGTWFALKWRGVASWRRTLLYSALTLAISGSIAAAIAFIAIDQADTIVRPNQAPLELEFEIRLPRGAQAPSPLQTAKAELVTDMNRMPARLIDRMTRKDGEHVVIGGRVELYFRTSNRLLALMLPKQPERTFPIRLPARPAPSDRYSAWVSAHAPQANRGIGVDFDVRYRVIDPVVSKAP